MRRRAALTTLSLALLVPSPAVAQESPTPSPSSTPIDCSQVPAEQGGCPTPSPTSVSDCAPSLETPASVPSWGQDGRGGAATVTVTLREKPGAKVTLHGYTRPSTEVRVLGRGTTSDTGTADIALQHLRGNTRVFASVEGCDSPSEHRIINVQPRMGGLTAHRHGPRDYTFALFYFGPNGKVGNLYRVLPDGREVLTSQTRMSGEYVMIRRLFTGSGRFGFVLRSGNDITSLAVSSNVRDTVVH